MTWCILAVVLLTLVSTGLLVILGKQARLIRRIRQQRERLPIAPAGAPEPRSYDYDNAVFVMAHRGLARYATENTGPAILLASTIGVNGIEVDIRFTKDHVPVLFHDRKLDRSTLQLGAVRDVTWEQLADIAVAPANRVLRLETFLEHHSRSFECILLDLKDSRAGLDRDHLNIIADCVRGLDVVEKTLVDSSSPECVDHVLALGLKGSWREPGLPPEQILGRGIRHISIDSARARALWEGAPGNWKGLHVTAICPPTVADAMWLIEREVFAIITDLNEEVLAEMAKRGYITPRAG